MLKRVIYTESLKCPDCGTILSELPTLPPFSAILSELSPGGMACEFRCDKCGKTFSRMVGHFLLEWGK